MGKKLKSIEKNITFYNTIYNLLLAFYSLTKILADFLCQLLFTKLVSQTTQQTIYKHVVHNAKKRELIKKSKINGIKKNFKQFKFSEFLSRDN